MAKIIFYLYIIYGSLGKIRAESAAVERMSMTLDELKDVIREGSANESTNSERSGIEVTSAAVAENLNDDFDIQFSNETMGSLSSLNTTVEEKSEDKTKKSLIESIELFESTHKAVKYPLSLGYKRGDDLNGYSIEQLEKINRVQRCVSSSQQMSCIGANLLISVSKVVEGYVESMEGYSNNLAHSITELQDVLQEILLEQSDSMPEINSPYVKLGLILGSAGITTYITNKSRKPKVDNTACHEGKEHDDVDNVVSQPTPVCNVRVATTSCRDMRGPYTGTYLSEAPTKRKYVRKAPTKKEKEKMQLTGMSLEQIRSQDSSR